MTGFPYRLYIDNLMVLRIFKKKGTKKGRMVIGEEEQNE